VVTLLLQFGDVLVACGELECSEIDHRLCRTYVTVFSLQVKFIVTWDRLFECLV